MIRRNRTLFTIVICTITIGSLLVQPRLACAGQGSNPSQVIASPTIESVSDRFAFISWTTENPGGTVLHNAVVRYGKDPNHLDFTAESPNRINPTHSEMVFRVRMNNLEPGTTYYYKVYSEQANGSLDPAVSAVNQFTTRQANRISIANK
jgi:hypothetical protein